MRTHFKTAAHIPDFIADNHRFFTYLRSGWKTPSLPLQTLRARWPEGIEGAGIHLDTTDMVSNLPPSIRYAVPTGSLVVSRIIIKSVHEGYSYLCEDEQGEFIILFRLVHTLAPYRTLTQAYLEVDRRIASSIARLDKKKQALREKAGRRFHAVA